MGACDNCGRPRKQGATFCTGCGSRFFDEDAPPANPYAVPEPVGPADQLGPAAPYGTAGRNEFPETYRPGAPRPSRRAGTRFPPAVVATVVMVVAAAAAAGGAVLFTSQHAPRGEKALNSGQSLQASPSAQGGSAPGQGGSAPGQGSSGPPPGPSGASSGGGITVASGVSQNSDASSVAAFAGQYFAAINAHDYHSYLSLLSPRLAQTMTQAQFDNGYRTTADSNETLVGLSTASDGDLAAEVTFTSHQDPADSPDHSESCTSWDISLFLAKEGSGYAIDPAPSGYQASYQPCS